MSTSNQTSNERKQEPNNSGEHRVDRDHEQRIQVRGRPDYNGLGQTKKKHSRKRCVGPNQIMKEPTLAMWCFRDNGKCDERKEREGCCCPQRESD